MIYKISFFLTEFVPGIGTGRQLQFFQHFHHCCFSNFDSSKKLRNRSFYTYLYDVLDLILWMPVWRLKHFPHIFTDWHVGVHLLEK